MKRNGRGKRYLIHTVLSFVSLIRRTIYFDSRSFPIFELRCRFVRKKFQYVWNKQNIPWKLLERFLFTSCDASKTHSFAPLTRWFFWCITTHEYNRSYARWNNLYCYIPRLSLNKMSTVIGWFLVTCPWSYSNVSRPGYNGVVVARAPNTTACFCYMIV